ncbi:hypothetical protein D3C80_2043070 [compost metagenome]
MKRMGDVINAVLIILLIATIGLNIQNGWKGRQLNQRYEDSLKQYEQANKEYIEYLENSRERLELQIRKAEQPALN